MFELLAEKRIREAIERGELDDLPGAGRALELDDDALVPEELRLAAAGEADGEAHAKALRRLALLKTRVEARYYRQVLGKLGR